MLLYKKLLLMTFCTTLLLCSVSMLISVASSVCSFRLNVSIHFPFSHSCYVLYMSYSISIWSSNTVIIIMQFFPHLLLFQLQISRFCCSRNTLFTFACGLKLLRKDPRIHVFRSYCLTGSGSNKVLK